MKNAKRKSKIPIIQQDSDTFKVPKPKANFNTDIRVLESHPTTVSMIANQNQNQD
jgi:hypothetical protein